VRTRSLRPWGGRAGVTEHQPHFAFVDVPIMVEQQAALREVAEARGIIAPGQTSELFRGRARGVPDLLYEVVADFLEANTEELDKITTARECAERALVQPELERHRSVPELNRATEP
jgi:hypothetical protein